METKVLIVDDDKIICKITKRMFQISGLSKAPIIFNSGKQALEFLKQENNKQQNTVVFLDINMPQIDGWEFIDLLEKENILEYTTIYLITSSIFPEDHIRAKKNKYVSDILVKPITLTKTKQLVAEINK
ncbi:MAG TPA: response regulator [Flavobacteriaceae bacterium]|jgi:CheY-like chemotaxis protein|nr:response regulator [Flavobacteriaceae bacterium]|tara:strand:+ start:20003 stop:20389 length:387 start_codon:yes stop_codon:yes gene_type:complete